MSRFIEIVTMGGESAFIRKDHITGLAAVEVNRQSAKVEIVTLNGGVWAQYYSGMPAARAGLDEILTELGE